MNQTRRAFLTSALASVALPLWAQAPTQSLRPVLRSDALGPKPLPGESDVIAASKFQGDLCFVILDAAGEVLAAQQPDRPMPPASVAKIVTALYALDALGEGFTFDTKLFVLGEVTEGVLEGDVVLAGSGDPTLASEDFKAMIAKLKELGIEKVDGRFMFFDAALHYLKSIEPGQPTWVGYSPAISGLNLNYNRVHFEWKPVGGSWTLSMEARGTGASPRVGVSRMRIATRETPVFTYETKDAADLWSVAKSALGKGGARWLPVRFPGHYAADAFRVMARDAGVALPVAAPLSVMPEGEAVYTHQSAALITIIRDMLKFSTNLTAEVLGMTATKSRGQTPKDLETSAFYMNLWAKERLSAPMDLVDHSGLSDRSRVSAVSMARLLRENAMGPLAGVLKPVRFATKRAVPGQVAAKTGTLNFVSGLAGYIDHAGERNTFAIFSNDLVARAAIAPNNKERPPGARGWSRRAKSLEIDLVDLWAKRTSPDQS